MKKGNGFMVSLIFIIGVGSLCAYHNIEKSKYLEEHNKNSIISEDHTDTNNLPVYIYQEYYKVDNNFVPTDKFVSTESIVKDDDNYKYRFIGASYSDEIVIYEKETKDSNGKWNKTNNYVLSAGSDSEYVRYVIKDVISNKNSNNKQKVK